MKTKSDAWYALHVVTGFRLQRGRNRQRSVVTEQEGMTIIGLGHGIHADHATGTGLVIDDHRLSEHRPQFVGNDPRHQINRAARRSRHDKADRLARPGLRRQCRENDQEREQGQKNTDESGHL